MKKYAVCVKGLPPWKCVIAHPLSLSSGLNVTDVHNGVTWDIVHLCVLYVGMHHFTAHSAIQRNEQINKAMDTFLSTHTTIIMTF